MKRLTAFCFSFFCCNPKIVSIFAPAMAKCIFYILLGLFLISKFTSVSDDMEGCKTLPTADVHYFSGAQHSLSGADGRQCQEKGEDANYNCLADAGCIGNTFSLRHASCSKLLRLNPDFIAAKVARTLKTLLPEEKTTSFPFTFHPAKGVFFPFDAKSAGSITYSLSGSNTTMSAVMPRETEPLSESPKILAGA